MQLANRQFNLKASLIPPLSLVRYQPPLKNKDGYNNDNGGSGTSAGFDAVKKSGIWEETLRDLYTVADEEAACITSYILSLNP